MLRCVCVCVCVYVSAITCVDLYMFVDECDFMRRRLFVHTWAGLHA
jgi:hypothetical protein